MPLRPQSRSRNILPPLSSFTYSFSHSWLPVAKESPAKRPDFCLRNVICKRKMNKILRRLPNLRFTPVISETWKVCMRFHADVNACPRGRITSVLSPVSSLKLTWLHNSSEDYSQENMCLYSTHHLFFLLKKWDAKTFNPKGGLKSFRMRSQNCFSPGVFLGWLLSPGRCSRKILSTTVNSR